MRQVFRGRGVVSLTKTFLGCGIYVASRWAIHCALYFLYMVRSTSTNDAKSVFRLKEVFFYAKE